MLALETATTVAGGIENFLAMAMVAMTSEVSGCGRNCRSSAEQNATSAKTYKRRKKNNVSAYNRGGRKGSAELGERYLENLEGSIGETSSVRSVIWRF